MKRKLVGVLIGVVIFVIGWTAGALTDLPSLTRGNAAQDTVLVTSSAAVAQENSAVAQNLAALFAAPTQSEIDTVLQDWKNRKPAVQGWRVEKKGTLNGFEVWVVSHLVDGNRHYGLVRFPAKFKAGGSYPVLVYNHAGNDGVSLQALTLLDEQFLPGGCLKDNFFYVVASYRAEKLDAGTLGEYKSEGQPSVLDRDVDDVISLLDGALANIPEADAQRVVSLGISRGGGVSLLMGERDQRVQAIVELAGETDFLMPSIQEEAVTLVHTRRLSVNPVMMTAMFSVHAYLDGKTPLQEARLALLRSSAVYFADRLPRLQFHHGAKDLIVPIQHSQRLNLALQSAEKAGPDYLYFIYDSGEHNILTLEGCGARVEKFLCQWTD